MLKTKIDGSLTVRHGRGDGSLTVRHGRGDL
jgi:hypothetical protein